MQRWFSAAAVMLAALAGIAAARAAPITVTDALGRSIVMPSVPQRLVTIFASNTELVAALGLGNRIVGVESYTRFPPEMRDKPLVGGRLGFSVDAVVAQKPDLVIVTPARQAMHQLLDTMDRIGVPVMVLLSRTAPEILANIRLLGRALGVPENGEAVAARLQARLDRVAAVVAGRTPPRVIMITGRLGNGLLLIARSGTYTGDAVRQAGGVSALGASLNQVSAEAVIAADPDILLFAGRQEDLDEMAGGPGFRDMRAIRDHRAFIVPRAELLIPGPRTFDGVERLAKLFHPEAFAP